MKELIKDYEKAYGVVSSSCVLKEELYKIFDSLIEQGCSYGQIYTGLYKAIGVILYEYEITLCLSEDKN